MLAFNLIIIFSLAVFKEGFYSVYGTLFNHRLVVCVTILILVKGRQQLSYKLETKFYFKDDIYPHFKELYVNEQMFF